MTLEKMVSYGMKATEKDINAVLEYAVKNYPADDVPRINVNKARAIELESGLSLRRSQAAAVIQYRSANPAVGYCSDLLVRSGGTSVLAEIPECMGAEHLLTRRAIDEATGRKVIDVVNWYRDYLNRFAGKWDDNPSPGNKAGGITNVAEKALGGVAKGGTTALTGVYAYAERIDRNGFVLMNTPGYDLVSLAGIAAGGANMIVFTTGRGSGIGSPVAPVIKIASNSRIAVTDLK